MRAQKIKTWTPFPSGLSVGMREGGQREKTRLRFWSRRDVRRPAPSPESPNSMFFWGSDGLARSGERPRSLPESVGSRDAELSPATGCRAVTRSEAWGPAVKGDEWGNCGASLELTPQEAKKGTLIRVTLSEAQESSGWTNSHKISPLTRASSCVLMAVG